MSIGSTSSFQIQHPAGGTPLPALGPRADDDLGPLSPLSRVRSAAKQHVVQISGFKASCIYSYAKTLRRLFVKGAKIHPALTGVIVELRRDIRSGELHGERLAFSADFICFSRVMALQSPKDQACNVVGPVHLRLTALRKCRRCHIAVKRRR